MDIKLDMLTKYMHGIRKAKSLTPLTEGVYIGLDPGETTGICILKVFEGFVYRVYMGQIRTWPETFMVAELTSIFDTYKPMDVTYERYAIYSWHSDDHAWSEVNTIQVIGCIKTLCIQRGLPFRQHTAQQAKNFCTDEKLQQWHLYEKGLRHGRDAARHAAYRLLFG